MPFGKRKLCEVATISICLRCAFPKMQEEMTPFFANPMKHQTIMHVVVNISRALTTYFREHMTLCTPHCEQLERVNDLHPS